MKSRSILLLTNACIVLTSTVAAFSSTPEVTDTDWSALTREVPGVDGTVYAVVKSGGKLYVGGTIRAAGSVAVKNVAMWDGEKWSALGSGLDGNVYALAVDKKGTVWAGGDFVSQQWLARWNGKEWNGINPGLEKQNMRCQISAVAFDSGGTVYFGGEFDFVGGKRCKNIAKWKEYRGFDSLGPGLSGEVCALAVDSQQTLYAGGWFQSPKALAKWNGTSWESVGGGIGSIKTGCGVQALICDKIGRLFVLGSFDSAGGVAARHIAVWSGTEWDSLGVGLEHVSGISGGALACDNGGNLYAGADFDSAGGKSAPQIAQWDGTGWRPLSSGLPGSVNALCVGEMGDVFIGGSFTAIKDIPAYAIVQWNGNSFGALGGGTNGASHVIVDAKGVLYRGGNFTVIDGVVANYIAKRTGNTWAPLGSGLDGVVGAMAVDRTGNLYVGGYFNNAGGVFAPRIAKWDGAAWSSMNGAMCEVYNGTVSLGTLYTLAVDASGALYVGGSFDTIGGRPVHNIARWNGNVWEDVGNGTNKFVETIAFDSSGTLYAGGAFDTAGGKPCSRIARWNGTSWDSLGSGIQGNWVSSIVVDRRGMVYAAGFCRKTVGGETWMNMAQWDGTQWLSLGGGTDDLIRKIELDDTGNLYACGPFATAGKVTAPHIARWNGTGWSALGSGTDGDVWWLRHHDGTLYAGGGFVSAGGKFSPFIAKVNVSRQSAVLPAKRDGVAAGAAPRWRIKNRTLMVWGMEPGDRIVLYSLCGRIVADGVALGKMPHRRMTSLPLLCELRRAGNVVAKGKVIVP
jgi:hypothetical protein